MPQISDEIEIHQCKKASCLPTKEKIISSTLKPKTMKNVRESWNDTQVWPEMDQTSWIWKKS